MDNSAVTLEKTVVYDLNMTKNYCNHVFNEGLMLALK